MSTDKTLKEQIADIHYSAYDLADSVLYFLKVREENAPHHVRDTNVQQVKAI